MANDSKTYIVNYDITANFKEATKGLKNAETFALNVSKLFEKTSAAATEIKSVVNTFNNFKAPRVDIEINQAGFRSHMSQLETEVIASAQRMQEAFAKVFNPETAPGTIKRDFLKTKLDDTKKQIKKTKEEMDRILGNDDGGKRTHLGKTGQDRKYYQGSLYDTYNNDKKLEGKREQLLKNLDDRYTALKRTKADLEKEETRLNQAVKSASTKASEEVKNQTSISNPQVIKRMLNEFDTAVKNISKNLPQIPFTVDQKFLATQIDTAVKALTPPPIIIQADLADQSIKNIRDRIGRLGVTNPKLENKTDASKITPEMLEGKKEDLNYTERRLNELKKKRDALNNTISNWPEYAKDEFAYKANQKLAESYENDIQEFEQKLAKQQKEYDDMVRASQSAPAKKTDTAPIHNIEEEKKKLGKLKTNLEEAKKLKLEAEQKLADLGPEPKGPNAKFAKTDVLSATGVYTTALANYEKQQKLVEELEKKPKATPAAPVPSTVAATSSSILTPEEENAIAAAIKQIDELESKLNKFKSKEVNITIKILDEVTDKIPKINDKLENIPKNYEVKINPILNNDAVAELRSQLRELGVLAQSSALKANENTAANAAASTAASKPVGSTAPLGPPLTDQDRARLKQLQESPELENLRQTRKVWENSKKGSVASKKKYEAYQKALEAAKPIFSEINNLEERDHLSSSLTPLTSREQVKAAKWQRTIDNLKSRPTLSEGQQKILAGAEKRLEALRGSTSEAPATPYSVSIGVSLDESSITTQINKIKEKVKQIQSSVNTEVILSLENLNSQMANLQTKVSEIPIHIKTILDNPEQITDQNLNKEEEKGKKGKGKKKKADTKNTSAVVAQEKTSETTGNVLDTKAALTELQSIKTLLGEIEKLKNLTIGITLEQGNLPADVDKVQQLISKIPTQIPIRVFLENTEKITGQEPPVQETKEEEKGKKKGKGKKKAATTETPPAVVAQQKVSETVDKVKGSTPEELLAQLKGKSVDISLNLVTNEAQSTLERFITENQNKTIKVNLEATPLTNGTGGGGATSAVDAATDTKKTAEKTAGETPVTPLTQNTTTTSDTDSSEDKNKPKETSEEKKKRNRRNNSLRKYVENNSQYKMLTENYSYFEEAFNTLKSLEGKAGLSTTEWKKFSLDDKAKILNKTMSLIDARGEAIPFQMQAEVNALKAQGAKLEQKERYTSAHNKWLPIAKSKEQLKHLIENDKYYSHAVNLLQAGNRISPDLTDISKGDWYKILTITQQLMEANNYEIPYEIKSEIEKLNKEASDFDKAKKRTKAHNKFFAAANSESQLNHMVEYRDYYTQALENFQAAGSKATDLSQLSPAGRKWILDDVERQLRAKELEVPVRIKTDREAYQAEIDKKKALLANKKVLRDKQIAEQQYNEAYNRMSSWGRSEGHIKHLVENERFYSKALANVQPYLSTNKPKFFTADDKMLIMNEAKNLMEQEGARVPMQVLNDAKTFRQEAIKDTWGDFIKNSGDIEMLDKYYKHFWSALNEADLDLDKPLSLANKLKILEGVEKSLNDERLQIPKQLSNQIEQNKTLLEQEKALLETTRKREELLNKTRQKLGLKADATPEKLTSGKAVLFLDELENAYAREGLEMPKEYRDIQKTARTRQANSVKSWASGNQFVNTAEQRNFIADNWKSLTRAAKDMAKGGPKVTIGEIMEYTNSEKLEFLEKTRGYMSRAGKEIPLMLDKEIQRLDKLVTEGLGGIKGGGFGPEGEIKGRGFEKKQLSLFDRARKWAYPFSGSTSFGSNTPMVVDMAKGMGVMFAVGGAMSAIGSSFSQAMEYQNTMETTRAILQHGTDTYSSSNFKNMEHIVRNVGISTKFSAPEVASAARFLAMAGQDINAINESIRPIADIALIGGTDLGETADKMTNIMTTFDIAPERMREVANILTTTATRSNTDLMMLAESAKYGGGVANMYGKGDKNLFADTMALFGIMGNAGIQGSSAGTALRMMYQNIFNPNKNQKAVLDALNQKYGITTTNKDGSFRGMAEIISDIARNVTDKKELAHVVSKLFRITAQPGANATLMAAVGGDLEAYNAMLKGDKEMSEELLKDGNLGKLAQLMMANRNAAYGNISGDTAEKMQNTIEGLWAQVTSTFTEGIVKAFESRQGGFESMLKDLRDYLARPETVTMLQNLLDLIVSIGKVMADFVAIWAKLYSMFPGMVKYWAVLQFAFTQFGSLVSPVVALIGVFDRFQGWLKNMTELAKTSAVTSAVTAGVEDAAKNATSTAVGSVTTKAAEDVAQSATKLVGESVSQTITDPVVSSAAAASGSATIAAVENMQNAAEDIVGDIPEILTDLSNEPSKPANNNRHLSRSQKRKQNNNKRKKDRKNKNNKKNNSNSNLRSSVQAPQVSNTVAQAQAAQAAAQQATQASTTATRAITAQTAANQAVATQAANQVTSAANQAAAAQKVANQAAAAQKVANQAAQAVTNPASNAAQAAMIGGMMAGNNGASANQGTANNTQPPAKKPGLGEKFKATTLGKSFVAGRTAGSISSFKGAPGLIGSIGALILSLFSSFSWIIGLIASPIGILTALLTGAGIGLYKWMVVLNDATDAQLRALENTQRLADQAQYEREKHSKWFNDYLKDPDNPLNKKFGHGLVGSANMMVDDEVTNQQKALLKQREKLFQDIYNDDLPTDASHQRTVEAATKWKTSMLDNVVSRLALGDKYEERVAETLNPTRDETEITDSRTARLSWSNAITNWLWGVNEKNANMVQNQRAYDMLMVEGALDPKAKEALDEFSDIYTKYLEGKLKKDAYDTAVANLRAKYIPEDYENKRSAFEEGISAGRIKELEDHTVFREYWEGLVNFLDANFDPNHEGSIAAYATAINRLAKEKLEAYTPEWYEQIRHIIDRTGLKTFVQDVDGSMKEVDLQLKMLKGGQIDSDYIYRQIKGKIDGYEENIYAFAKLSTSIYQLLVQKGFITGDFASLKYAEKFVGDQLKGQEIDAKSAGWYYDHYLSKNSAWTEALLNKEDFVNWQTGTLMQQTQPMYDKNGKPFNWIVEQKKMREALINDSVTGVLGENFDKVQQQAQQNQNTKSKLTPDAVDQKPYASKDVSSHEVKQTNMNINGGINPTVNIYTYGSDELVAQLKNVVPGILLDSVAQVQAQVAMAEINEV